MTRPEPQNRGTSEPQYSYRNLILWQRAQEFPVAVVDLVDALPARRSADAIARQIVRSATSVAANIAEGRGRFSPASYKNHLSIAKGSACETDSWIDLLCRLDLISTKQEADLHKRCMALVAGLTGRIRDLERITPRAAREEQAEYNSVSEGEAFEVPRF